MVTTYCIYKLEDPRGQVGMPGTHKWAVGVRYDKQSHPGFGFVDAFRTKRGARDFIHSKGACTVCGEVLQEGLAVTVDERCACERANLKGCSHPVEHVKHTVDPSLKLKDVYTCGDCGQLLQVG